MTMCTMVMIVTVMVVMVGVAARAAGMAVHQRVYGCRSHKKRKQHQGKKTNLANLVQHNGGNNQLAD